LIFFNQSARLYKIKHENSSQATATNENLTAPTANPGGKLLMIIISWVGFPGQKKKGDIMTYKLKGYVHRKQVEQIEIVWLVFRLPSQRRSSI
jgi:hypothetical protein